MNHDIDKIRKNPKLEGQIGENGRFPNGSWF
jgi:hypothetical protein